MAECLYCGMTTADVEFAEAEGSRVEACCVGSLEELAARVVFWPETGLVTVL